MRWRIIANPVAGKGRARVSAPKLAEALKDRGDDVDLCFTTDTFSAEALAREAMDSGAEGVVACGGDGTVHQVINGLMEASSGRADAVLGLLPTGRCDDLAISLGIPRRDGDAAIDTILSGTPRAIDLGRIGNRYFATVATLGFDSEVAGYVGEGKPPRFLKGTAAYMYAILVKLVRYRDVTVELRGDFGEYRGDIFLAATGNTAYYGGGMKIVPPADPYDGWLDLCLVKSAPRLDVIRMISKVFSGGHLKHSAVSVHSVKRLQVTSPQSLWLWADGEPMTQLPATVEVAPACLDVLAPALASIPISQPA